MQTICGRNYNSSSSTDQGGGTTFTFRARGIQSIYHFDSSGVSGATAVAWKQMGGYMHTDSIVSGAEKHDHIDIIALKGNAASTTNNTAHWNDFVGFSISPAWTSSDTTPYSSNVTVNAPYSYATIVANPSGSSTTITIDFNSTALTDVNDDDTFQFLLMEYDRFYLNSTSAFRGYNGWGVYMGAQIDNTTTAYRPYLDVTTGTTPATPTDNAVFFGTNF